MGYYQKSPYPPTGYSGYVDELSNQLNTAVISYASVCILQAGAFRILQKIFKNFALFLAKQKVACIISRKGEVLPPFGRKEVNTMTPNRREFEKQCALFHITDLFIDPVPD